MITTNMKANSLSPHSDIPLIYVHYSELTQAKNWAFYVLFSSLLYLQAKTTVIVHSVILGSPIIKFFYGYRLTLLGSQDRVLCFKFQCHSLPPSCHCWQQPRRGALPMVQGGQPISNSRLDLGREQQCVHMHRTAQL